MVCEVGQNVIVCGSWTNPDCIRYIDCPACKRRRRALVHYSGFYYGHDLTCLGCGSQWDEMGFCNPRKRDYARKVDVTAARQRATKAVKRAEYEAICRADFESHMEAA